MRIVIGNRPDVVLEERASVADRGYRWRAYLKGRSGGGYDTAYGPTARKALEELRDLYQDRLATCDTALTDLPRMLRRGA